MENEQLAQSVITNIKNGKILDLHELIKQMAYIRRQTDGASVLEQMVVAKLNKAVEKGEISPQLLIKAFTFGNENNITLLLHLVGGQQAYVNHLFDTLRQKYVLGEEGYTADNILSLFKNANGYWFRHAKKNLPAYDHLWQSYIRLLREILATEPNKAGQILPLLIASLQSQHIAFEKTALMLSKLVRQCAKQAYIDGLINLEKQGEFKQAAYRYAKPYTSKFNDKITNDEPPPPVKHEMVSTEEQILRFQEKAFIESVIKFCHGEQTNQNLSSEVTELLLLQGKQLKELIKTVYPGEEALSSRLQSVSFFNTSISELIESTPELGELKNKGLLENSDSNPFLMEETKRQPKQPELPKLKTKLKDLCKTYPTKGFGITHHTKTAAMLSKEADAMGSYEQLNSLVKGLRSTFFKGAVAKMPLDKTLIKDAKHKSLFDQRKNLGDGDFLDALTEYQISLNSKI